MNGHMYACVVAVSACLATSVHGQELVTNGGFEQPVVGGQYVQRTPGTTFGGWTVDNVGQGIVHVASFGSPTPEEGHQCVELNWYVPCGVSQTLTTIPGDRYILTFLMAGQTNQGPDLKVMTVDWDGHTVEHAQWSRSGTGGHWERHTYSVLATASSTVVHFFGETTVDGGPYLDAVSVMHWCPADFNQDSAVDFADYLDFVTALNSLDSSADINFDGVTDFFDYLDFLQYFGVGC